MIVVTLAWKTRLSRRATTGLQVTDKINKQLSRQAYVSLLVPQTRVEIIKRCNNNLYFLHE